VITSPRDGDGTPALLLRVTGLQAESFWKVCSSCLPFSRPSRQRHRLTSFCCTASPLQHWLRSALTKNKEVGKERGQGDCVVLLLVLLMCFIALSAAARNKKVPNYLPLHARLRDNRATDRASQEMLILSTDILWIFNQCPALQLFLRLLMRLSLPQQPSARFPYPGIRSDK
jgi:hypothetical protein